MKKLILLVVLAGAVYWWWLPHTVQGPSSAHEFEYIIRTSGAEDSSDPLPMVIALHGNGDKPDNFFKTLFKGFDSPARFIVIRGPADYAGAGFGGRAWPIDSGGLQEYGDALADAVPVLLERYSTEGRPIVLGFSGGAYFAYYLAACHADRFSYIFPLSGGLPSLLSCEKGKAGAKVIAFHGKGDRVISFGRGMAAVNHLKQRGLNVEMVTFDGGHLDLFRSLNDRLLNKLRDSMKRITSYI